MVNGNYVLYGDRPSSESEIVDDHVQTRTAERKTKRKANRTANELQHTLNLAQLDNETDSVKYEKKIKEPRLLRYVPTTDVEQHFVTEKFETYDLKPTIERPKRYAYVKKPKNPSDGPINNAYSRSCSSSPNGNLPTISEHCEQYGTYRMSPANHDIPSYESKLEKYFTKPRDITKFSAKVDYNGSHPDSLYRVPPGAGAVDGATRAARALRLLRWPAALLLVCVALAGFVYFLMPGSLGPDLDMVNSTYWDNTILSADVGARNGKLNDTPAQSTESTKLPDATEPAKTGKTPEIDFYDPDLGKDIDLVSLVDKGGENNSKKNLPASPVFPDHIAPEVQYGNEKADTRAPKIIEKGTPADSTVKPHITLKPEKPLAVYFKDAAAESIARAETINDLSNKKQTTKSDDSRRYPSRYKQPTYEVSKDRQRYNDPELPPEFQEFYKRPAHGEVPLTSGHSKFFGIGIEDLDKMTSPTTQSSLYNTRVSPTLPTWRDRDDSTTKYYPINDAPQCQSPRLPLCRGVLPYDLAGKPPTIDGQEMASLMPQIEYLINSNCSHRMRQYLCAILEPECSPAPYPPKLPCYNFCKAMVDNCQSSIPRELSTAFKCKQYASSHCTAARSPCSVRELPCGDGSCVPRDWVCDGKNDCPAGEDEAQCVQCDLITETKCASGSCILKNWVCDGYNDCPDGDDETEEACERLQASFNFNLTTTTRPIVSDLAEEPAESAPAPSVRKPSRKEGRAGSRKAAQSQTDASQELLITSDSSNALKRNFTRRPSTSRLTPYVPKVRVPAPAEPQSEDLETEKPFKSMKTSRRRTTKPPVTTPEPELIDEIGDLGFIEEYEKEMKAKEIEKKNPKNAASSHPTAQKYERMSDGEAEKPAMRFDKTLNNYERVIDGTALMKQAAIEEEKEKAEPENTTSYDEDEFPAKKGSDKRVLDVIGTSHSSPCPSGELRCVDGRCITLAQLCDGTIDCSDHADEDNCYT